MFLVSFWSVLQDCIDALFSLADISDGGNGILKSASVSELEILHESQPTFAMGPKDMGKNLELRGQNIQHVQSSLWEVR